MLQVKRLMASGLSAMRRSGGRNRPGERLQPDAGSFGFPVDSSSERAGSSGVDDTTSPDSAAVDQHPVVETPGIRGHKFDGFGFGIGNAAPIGADTEPADVFCPSDKVSALVSLCVVPAPLPSSVHAGWMHF